MDKFVKCPRCELNYMTVGETCCKVCKLVIKGCSERDHEAEYEAWIEAHWKAKQAQKEAYEAYRAVRYNIPQRRRV